MYRCQVSTEKISTITHPRLDPAIIIVDQKILSLTILGPLTLHRISSHYSNNKTHVLSWEPPFSLNLTDVEPDVVYFVEVYRLNTTCYDYVLISSTRVLQPMFLLSDPSFPYEVIVTPRSNVDGARNGTSAKYSGT